MFILVPALALALLFLILIIVIHGWRFLLFPSPASPGMLKARTRSTGEMNISIAWMITAILFCYYATSKSFIIDRFIKFKIDLGIDDVMIKLFIMFLLPMVLGFMIK